MLSVKPTITLAMPPVAIVVTPSPSSARSLPQMPSTWAANPYTIPDWTAPSVDLPISDRGSAMSTLVSRAAREVSASIEISMPGPMMPPRYSPALDTTS